MAHKDDARLICLDRNGAGVGIGELLPHLQLLPALTGVGAGEDFARRGGEDRLGLSHTDCDAVDVWVGQPAGNGHPGVPSIQAPAHPIHLNACPDGPVVLRVHHQRRHTGDDHRRALFGQLHGQFFPPLAPVPGAKHRRGSGPGKDGVRLDGINGQGPDMQRVHRRVQPSPARATVLAAIHPRVGASIDDVGFPRMNRQRPDIALRVATGPDTGPGRPAIGTPPDSRPHSAYTDGKIGAHH